MGQVLSGLGQQGGYGQRRSGTRQTGGGSPYGGIYGPNGDIPGYYLGGSGAGGGGNSGSGSSAGYSDPLGGLHYGSGDPKSGLPDNTRDEPYGLPGGTTMPNPQRGGGLGGGSGVGGAADYISKLKSAGDGGNTVQKWGGGGMGSEGLGDPLGGLGFGSSDPAKDRSGGGMVEATPPDLGGMTIENPMRKRRGTPYSPEQQRY